MIKFFTSFDQTKIFYKIGGKGKKKETILFLHGLGGNMRAWDTQISFFQNAGYQTIAFDLRGHGLSDRPKSINDYNINKFAEDILFFLKIHPIKKIVLVGHCLGGVAALKTAEQLKTKPKALVVISASTRPFRFNAIFSKYPQLLQFLANTLLKFPLSLGKIKQISFEKFFGTGDFNIRRVASDIFYTTLQSYLAILNYVTILNNDDLLSCIVCPTLIIHGAKDKIIPISAAYNLHKNIKHSKLIILPTANHVIPINNPKKLTKHIKTYVETKNL